jgi:hypothetical protein
VLAPDAKLLALLGGGLASLAVLIWMIAAGPGYLGYGAALLWGGWHAKAGPFYDIRVTPGDASVRRNTDELVTAQPIGIQTDKVRLYARYHSASKWEQLTMQPQPGGSAFQFMFAGLPEGVEYYVEAGAVHSRHFNIRVVDLPAVKQIRVTYHFPAWTGLKEVVDEHGSDLRAVEGTQAALDVITDRPLRDGVLMLDNGQQIQLTGGTNNHYSGAITMEKDGAYHVAAIDQGQPVRLSEDFFIAANKANPPEVQIVRPGRDYRASPIEEVTIFAKASDEFALNDLSLHYSVNGGPEQTASLLKQKGVKEADGSTTLYLENFKLVPGDLVSFYASAKDARAESHTDMFFIQADPFERDFSQSQQAGGGGGGHGNQNDISDREKEIIAATWKQQGNQSASSQQAAEQGKFLSEVQSKLRDQAIALAGRLQLRDMTQANDGFSAFQKDMNAAAQAMNPAADKLHRQKWHDALPDEQKALQHLLQAEATFRQIQVAFGNNGGGGGGGGASRDLASLFDLELDTQKNQYETAQTASSAGNSREQQIDDAMKKLDELARRQQELAQQRNNNGQTFDQRWQQEMLRREAEQLQRQMEQMAQSQQNGNSSSPSTSSQSSNSSGQSGSGQSQSSSDPRVQQALNSLRQADEAMRRAGSPQQGGADARSAADRLREAENLLNGVQRQQSSGRLDSIARDADRLAATQREQSDQLRRLSQQNPSDNAQMQDAWNKAQALAQDRQHLADDLSRLEKQMRDAARDLASTQQDAASKLRDALGEMDSDDLQTRVQRSADWLRRGYAPNSESTESEIAKDLDRLGGQVRDAQRALGSGQSPQDSQTALDRVQRLKDQMEALTRGLGARDSQNRQQAQLGRDGQRGGQPGSQQGGQQAGGQQAQQGQAGPGGAFGPGLDRNGGANARGYRDDGYYTGGQRAGGDGRGNWWIDTGNNSNLPGAVPPDRSQLPPDPELTYQQSVSNLNQLLQTFQNDPEEKRELQGLIQEMQRLDPKRFPGNPALLEQIHNQVLTDVNNLELRMQRKLGDQPGQIRSTDPVSVPAGYEDAVAEYFRRLSKTP